MRHGDKEYKQLFMFVGIEPGEFYFFPSAKKLKAWVPAYHQGAGLDPATPYKYYLVSEETLVR